MIKYLDFKKYRRFFSFGCSFTNYYWPTWADIICREFTEGHNFGISGSGNQCIFNHFMQAHQIYKFGPADLVIVNWTNVLREDRYSNRRWVTPGNIYTQSVYDSEFVTRYVDNRGFFIRDMAAISAVYHMLQFTGCDWDFFSMLPIDKLENFNLGIVGDNDVIDMYQGVLANIKPSFFEVLYSGDWARPVNGFKLVQTKMVYQKQISIDLHPSTEMHKYYLDQMYPGINWSNNTLEFIEHINKKLSSDTITGHVPFQRNQAKPGVFL